MDELQLTRALIDRATEKFSKKNVRTNKIPGPVSFKSLGFLDGEAFVGDITFTLKGKVNKRDGNTDNVIGLTSLKNYYDGVKNLSPRARKILCLYLETEWEKFVEEHSEMSEVETSDSPVPLAFSEAMADEPLPKHKAEETSKYDGAERKNEEAADRKRLSHWLKVAVFAGVFALTVSAFYIREISTFLQEILLTIKQGPPREPAIVEMSDEQPWLISDHKEIDNDIIRLQPADNFNIVPQNDPVVQAEEFEKRKASALMSKPIEVKKESDRVFYNAAESADIAVYAVKNNEFSSSLAALIKTWCQQQNISASISFLNADFYTQSFFERAYNGDAFFLTEGNVRNHVSYLFLLKADVQISASKVQADLKIGKAKYEIRVVNCRTGSVVDSYNFIHTNPGISEEGIEQELQNIFLQEIKNHPLPIK